MSMQNQSETTDIQSYLQFDPFKIPAQVDLALVHKRAQMCGISQSDSEHHCPCCGMSINQNKIPLCQNTINLSFLGQGIPLFFQITIQIIVIVFILWLVFGLYSLITNYINGDCIDETNSFYSQSLNYNACMQNCPQESTEFILISKSVFSSSCNEICSKIQDICILSIITQMSFANKQFNEEFKIIQSILVLCSILIFKLLMVKLRISEVQIIRICDQDQISPSDFTAMLTNLPSNNFTEKELKNELLDFCYKFDSKSQYEIVKVIIAYDISKFIEFSREKMTLEKKIERVDLFFKQYKRMPKRFTQQQYDEIKDKLKNLDDQLQQIEEEVENQSYQHQTEVAFITFQTKQQLQSILDQTKLSHWEELWIYIKYQLGSLTDQRGFYFKGNIIRFCRAPEPNDVFWENCGFNFKYQLKKRIYSHLITALLLIISFSILLGLNIFQNNQTQTLNNIAFIIITLIISLMITIMNQIIYYFIRKLGQSEKHFTKTHHDVSVSIKLAYVQFFNSGLLTNVINILIYYFSSNSHSTAFAFQRNGGTISDAFYLLFVNSFFVPILCYFDPLYLIKLYKQFTFKDINTMNQVEANKLFEGPQVQLYENYAHICLSLWLALFFAPLLPIALLLCCIGLIFYYWIQKYLLLRRNSKPPFQSYHLSREVLNFIELSPILFSIGQLWVDSAFNSQSATLTIDFISLGLSCIELFTPAFRISKWFTKKQNIIIEKERYQDVFLQLSTDYDRTNPITQQNAIQEFIKAKCAIDSNYKPIPVYDTKTALQRYAQIGGVQYLKNSILIKIKMAMMRKIKLIRKNRKLNMIPFNLNETELSQEVPKIYNLTPNYQIINKHIEFQENSMQESTDGDKNYNQYQQAIKYNFQNYIQLNKFEL